MRIISGKYKGRHFDIPRNFKARPTTDFAKENLFNILLNLIDFEETNALDLFSGTGSISLELLSRGCTSVTSVEMDSLHFSHLKKSAAALLEMKATAGKCFARRPYFEGSVQRTLPNYHIRDLLLALAGIVNEEEKPTAFIEPQAFSVQEKMTDILERLKSVSSGFRLSDLFSVGSRGEKVASFLGVLELLKIGAITISQSEQFAPIYIFAKQGEQ